MKSNRIQIKFASETHYEKFTFNSETITYQEIVDYLVRKKKLGDYASRKTDNLTILNVDKNMQEVNSGIVDAGTRLIVIRKPEGSTFGIGSLIGSSGGCKSDSIELTYNPKQTIDRNRASKERIISMLNQNPSMSVEALQGNISFNQDENKAQEPKNDVELVESVQSEDSERELIEPVVPAPKQETKQKFLAYKIE